MISTPPAVVIHTSGTTLVAQGRFELTYGNFLWSALGSGRRAPAWTPASAGCAALPVSHVGGLSILLRSAIYATTRDRPRALSKPTVFCGPYASRR